MEKLIIREARTNRNGVLIHWSAENGDRVFTDLRFDNPKLKTLQDNLHIRNINDLKSLVGKTVFGRVYESKNDQLLVEVESLFLDSDDLESVMHKETKPKPITKTNFSSMSQEERIAASRKGNATKEFNKLNSIREMIDKLKSNHSKFLTAEQAATVNGIDAILKKSVSLSKIERVKKVS